MNCLLVTGGAGFIGSNFVRDVVENHFTERLIVLDKLTYAGNLANIQDVIDRGDCLFVKGDIADRELVLSLLAGHRVDAIVNFAAESHVDRSIMGARAFVQTNVLGAQTLLEAALQRKVPRFLQISTDEVYGSLAQEGSFSEDHPLSPSNPYAATKAAADLLCHSYFKTYGLPVVITRCSNNYGEYQFPEKLIPLMILNAMRDKPLPVYGEGLNVRDWIYVRDHCKAIRMALEKGRAGEIYNVGGANERRNIDLVRMILRKLGKSESLIRFVSDRPGHDYRYAVNAEKIKNELGWSPATSFEEGMDRTIRWYGENPAWVEGIMTEQYRRYYEDNYGKRGPGPKTAK